MPSSTCRFVTFGCKVNQYDTQALREDLAGRGMVEAERGGPADVVVVNTCTVTETAAREALRTIRQEARRPGARVVVTGCMVRSHREVLQRIPGIAFLAPNEAKPVLAERLVPGIVPGPKSNVQGQATLDGGRGTLDFSGAAPVWLEGDLADTFRLTIGRFEGRTRAYVKAQDGCNLVCSYCIIPRVRGRSRSRDPGETEAEVRRLVAAGYREIVLTGVHLGSFGRDLPGRPRFTRLLERLLRTEGGWRLRVSSIEASELHAEDVAAVPDLVAGAAGGARLCPHLHLPLQSGSPSVLRRMRRPYTLEQFEAKIDALRSRIPDLAITTDLLVGFPGETREDFDATLSAAHRIGFSRVHVFPYSERSGTAAAGMADALPEREIRARGRELTALARETAAAFHRGFVGRRVEVAVEDRPDRRTGRPVGYSEHYVRVLIEPGSPVGGLAGVRVTRADEAGMEGVNEK